MLKLTTWMTLEINRGFDSKLLVLSMISQICLPGATISLSSIGCIPDWLLLASFLSYLWESRSTGSALSQSSSVLNSEFEFSVVNLHKATFLFWVYKTVPNTEGPCHDKLCDWQNIAGITFSRFINYCDTDTGIRWLNLFRSFYNKHWIL